MARTFTVPQFARTTQANGADVRTLDTAAGGAVSTATLVQWTLTSVVDTYFRPEQTAAATNEALIAAGSRKGWGWEQALAIVNSPQTDPYTIEAGTYTIKFGYQRAGGIGTADRGGNFTVALMKVNSAHGFVDEIGRATVGSGGITTTAKEATVSIVLGSAVSFAAGDLLYYEIHFDCTDGVAAGTCDAHIKTNTNAAGLCNRLHAVPNYTIQEVRANSESIATTDTLARAAGYGRALSENIVTSDALARSVGHIRSLIESLTTSETLARIVGGIRGLAEAISTNDTLARQSAYHRALMESIATADILGRQIGYRRALIEDLTTGGGGSVPDGTLRLRADGRIEAVNAGAVPAGVLRIVANP